MDGGGSLNLLYVEALKKMEISESCIRASGTRFKDIIPGMEGHPLGQVTLDVVFGTPENYHLESLCLRSFHSKVATTRSSVDRRSPSLPHYRIMLT